MAAACEPQHEGAPPAREAEPIARARRGAMRNARERGCGSDVPRSRKRRRLAHGAGPRDPQLRTTAGCSNVDPAGHATPGAVAQLAGVASCLVAEALDRRARACSRHPDGAGDSSSTESAASSAIMESGASSASTAARLFDPRRTTPPRPPTGMGATVVVPTGACISAEALRLIVTSDTDTDTEADEAAVAASTLPRRGASLGWAGAGTAQREPGRQGRSIRSRNGAAGSKRRGRTRGQRGSRSTGKGSSRHRLRGNDLADRERLPYCTIS